MSDELSDTLAGLVWIAKRNGLGDDPYVHRAEEILSRTANELCHECHLPVLSGDVDARDPSWVCHCGSATRKQGSRLLGGGKAPDKIPACKHGYPVRDDDPTVQVCIDEKQREEDLSTLQNYLDWQYAITGGGSTEEFHRQLVFEGRPWVSLVEAREAIDRLRAEG